MPDKLLLFDFPSIHAYVFATDRAREIRGASALVDRLNRNDLPKILRGAGAAQIHANGGNGSFVVPERRDGELSELRVKVRAAVRDASGRGLEVAFGCADLNGARFDSVLRRAGKDMQCDRYAPRATDDLLSPYARRCASCGHEPAIEQSRLGETVTEIGAACVAKRDAWSRNRADSVWAKLLERLGVDRREAEDLRPDDFSAIGKRSRARHGYLAIIYADGDAMGELFRTVDTKQRYQALSRIVDECTFEATLAALKPIFERRGQGKVPADVLLLGGDDVVAVTTPEDAFPFALALAKQFQSETRERLLAAAELSNWRERPLSLSVGIAFARADQPFRDTVDRAEELLRLAKRTRERPAIDFADVSQSRYAGIEDARRLDRTIALDKEHTVVLHRRPMSLKQAEDLLAATERLQTLGSTRMRNLLAAVGLEPHEARFAVRRLYGRASSDQRRTIRNAMEQLECWSGHGFITSRDDQGHTTDRSPLGDVEELHPFVPAAAGEDG